MQIGNVFKGWEGVANANKAQYAVAGGRKQQRFTQQDRLFSYSSITAPNQEEEYKNGKSIMFITIVSYDGGAGKKLKATLGKSGKA